MRRYSALAAALVCLGTAAPAADAAPVFVDTWKARVQSDVLKGNAGRRTYNLSFDRPRTLNFSAYRVRGVKKLPLKLRRGWLEARYRVKKPCYTARYIYRFRASRVHDMEGEPVASRARMRLFNSWRTCSGDSFRSWFGGTAVRDTAPERGPADVSYDSPDGCDAAMVELSADEDASVFTDWDRALSYLWTFSDDASSTAARPKHRFPGPGSHSATVVIHAVNGSVAKATQTIDIPEAEACS